MHHYLFVGDGEAHEVLGVWEVDDEMAALKLNLQLSLMYPSLTTVSDNAPNFEHLKANHEEYDFGWMEPDDSVGALPQ